MRWLGVLLALGLAVWHALASFQGVSAGLWDLGVRLGLFGWPTMTYGEQVAIERAIAHGMAVGTLELLGGIVRGGAALLVLGGLGALLGSTRQGLGRLALVTAVVLHGLHALVVASAGLWTWEIDDHLFMATWAGDRGVYAAEGWVGFRLFGALALSAAAVVADGVLTGGVVAMIRGDETNG